jgi:hypothetical protein
MRLARASSFILVLMLLVSGFVLAGPGGDAVVTVTLVRWPYT